MPLLGRTGKSFQDLTGEAFADLLSKHDQPVGLKASLRGRVLKAANRSVQSEVAMPYYDEPTPGPAAIRRFIEKAVDINDVRSGELEILRALVERHWPRLSSKPRHTKH